MAKEIPGITLSDAQAHAMISNYANAPGQMAPMVKWQYRELFMYVSRLRKRATKTPPKDEVAG